MPEFNGKLVLQQRVLPVYRAAFFDTLAERCTGGLAVFTGQPRPNEGISPADTLEHASLTTGRNIHLLKGPLYLCRQPELLGWLAESNPDALIVEANPRYPDTREAIAWMKAQKRPVLGWGLGAPPLQGPMTAVRELVRRRLLYELDGVIAYSQRGAEEYRALGVPADRVFVAYNAAVPRPANTPPAKADHFEGQPVLLFVGRLQARKRLDLLFQACANLPEASQPHILVVGDGPERAAFEAQAAATYPKTTFLGAKHGAELEPIYAQADLFVLPGTGGLAIQQAMTAGLPVIVAQGDGTQEDLVRPGKNGWLVRPDDLASLQHALESALTNAAQLRRMGHESLRITREEINLGTMADAFIHALNEVKHADH